MSMIVGARMESSAAARIPVFPLTVARWRGKMTGDSALVSFLWEVSMLPKLLAGALLAVVLAALTTMGVVYYSDYSGPADEPTPCSHQATAPGDAPACCDLPPAACVKPACDDDPVLVRPAK